MIQIEAVLYHSLIILVTLNDPRRSPLLAELSGHFWRLKLTRQLKQRTAWSKACKFPVNCKLLTPTYDQLLDVLNVYLYGCYASFILGNNIMTKIQSYTSTDKFIIFIYTFLVKGSIRQVLQGVASVLILITRAALDGKFLLAKRCMTTFQQPVYPPVILQELPPSVKLNFYALPLMLKIHIIKKKHYD